LVEKLGVNHSIPLEVLPFALPIVMVKVRELGGKPVLREGKGKVGPVVTDNGNFVVDVDFGPVDFLSELDVKLKLVPGVLETGLFVGIADVVYVGGKTGVQRLVRG
ncbi:MAG: ribose-5-phosphate isomerase A, partial [Candidatus Bathyarchaeota archaeon]|nr:ribose-5-phosphate isomerase A [Candidatus Bathyarchaeota archaeon]